MIQGIGVPDLRKAPGHYPATPLPGQLGNAAIAGHRTTYGAPFNRLDELAAGDPIIITRWAGRFQYTVTPQQVVSPKEVCVLDPTPNATLTLTTCNPKFSASTAARGEGRARRRHSPKPQKAAALPVANRASLDDGLSGGRGEAPDVLVGILAAAFGALWRLIFHRYHRWTTWLMGAIPFAVVLFVFYYHLERLLPANYDARGTSPCELAAPSCGGALLAERGQTLLEVGARERGLLQRRSSAIAAGSSAPACATRFNACLWPWTLSGASAAISAARSSAVADASSRTAGRSPISRGLVDGHRASGEQEVPRRALADEHREPGDVRRAQQHAELRRRDADLRDGCHDAQVARDRELHPRTERRAVHRGDDRRRVARRSRRAPARTRAGTCHRRRARAPRCPRPAG